MAKAAGAARRPADTRPARRRLAKRIYETLGYEQATPTPLALHARQRGWRPTTFSAGSVLRPALRMKNVGPRLKLWCPAPQFTQSPLIEFPGAICQTAAASQEPA